MSATERAIVERLNIARHVYRETLTREREREQQQESTQEIRAALAQMFITNRNAAQRG
jgi:hypothetical protein